MRTRYGVASVLLVSGIAALCAGCGDDADTVRPLSVELLPTPSSVLAALPDGRLVVDQGSMLLALDPRRPDTAPVVIGAASGVGEVRAVTTLDGATLVLTTTGAFVLRGDSWVASPLASALDGPIVDAAVLPARNALTGPEIWISTATSLYRVRDGTARRLMLEGDFANAQLAVGARPEAASLWVRLPDRVIELWTDGTGELRTARLVLPAQPSALGADATRTVWLVIDGQLRSLGADRRLVEHDVSVARLLTSPLSPEVWIVAGDGKLWLRSDGKLLEVLGTAVAGELATLGVDGALYTVAPGTMPGSAGSVWRHAPRHDVVIGGPADGALLVTDQTFPVTVVGDATPTIEAHVDEVPVPVAREPLRVELDSGALSDGLHELAIDVAFDDGTLPIRERRSFELLTTATWTTDIEPLYVAHCATCHGPAGPANTRLDAPADWQMRIADVRTNVETGRMPLGQQPLAQRQTALIQAWELGGFRE